MTTGQIPIIDGSGKAVATLRWEGGPLEGKGRWEYLEDGAADKVKEAIRLGKGLGEQSFSDMYCDGSTTRGWEGFSGWFQALSLAMPQVNLAVNCDGVEWPSAEIEPE